MDEEKRNDALRELVNSPGWAVFVGELEDNLAIVKNIDQSTCEKTLFINKGQAVVLQNILNLKPLLNGDFDTVDEDEEAADDTPLVH